MLGQALYAEGLARGMDIIRIGRERCDRNFDLTDDAVLHQTLHYYKPDFIVNAAALANIDECEKRPSSAYVVNARMPSVLAAYVNQSDAYLVHVSTDHYFTGDADKKHTELDYVTLLNEYARTKYAGEAFVLSVRNTLVLRTNIVGFRGHGAKTFIEWALQALREQEAVPVFVDFYTSSIDVYSFAVALYDLLSKQSVGLINLASREVSNKQRFIQALADKFCLKQAQLIPKSVVDLNGVRRAESLGLDVTKAERILGRQLPVLDQVIENLFLSNKGGNYAL